MQVITSAAARKAAKTQRPVPVTGAVLPACAAASQTPASPASLGTCTEPPAIRRMAAVKRVETAERIRLILKSSICGCDSISRLNDVEGGRTGEANRMQRPVQLDGGGSCEPECT